MFKSSISKFFYLVAILLPVGLCQAQWQGDVRLTNDPASSNTNYNYAWCVAASGNTVHVVWPDYRDGNSEIYYKRSPDVGMSWGTDVRLTNNTAYSAYPSVAVSGLVVFAAWYDTRDGNMEEYCKRSTDGGVIWGPDTRLTNNSAVSEHCSIAVTGSMVYLVWEDQQDGNWEIYCKRSTDGGLNWGSPARLSNNPAASWDPSVTLSYHAVHVVWRDYRDGNWEEYYSRSTDNGLSWSPETRLTYNASVSYYSCQSIACSNPNTLHLVWSANRDGNYEIYYKRSTDIGTSWGQDVRLTNNSAVSEGPSVAISGLNVHVVWYDSRDGNTEIYYKGSTDGGQSWGADTRLTNNPGSSTRPSTSFSNSILHVVWEDNRDGNYEIYYKRDNLVGIKNINSEVPNEFNLYQNYPNPFNPAARIRFDIKPPLYPLLTKEGTEVVLKVFDILGWEVAILVNDQLTPGTYEVDFDGTNYPSGVYYYRLTTADFTQSRRMILLK